MLKQKYFLTDFFILSAEKQPIKLSWRNIEWLQNNDLTATHKITFFFNKYAKMERIYLCISLFFNTSYLVICL